MERKPFENILGPHFDCKDDPPQADSGCPALSNIMGGIELDSETGEWLCPLCYSVVHIEQDDEDQMFDDDEDDGEAFENDSTFTAEGDRLITFTEEERLRITRVRQVESAIFKLSGINNKFAQYLEENTYYIVDEVRVREAANEPAFSGKLVLPKILAIAKHRSNLPLPDSEMRLIGVNPSLVRPMIKALQDVSQSENYDPFSNQLYYIGNAIGISNPILKVLIEQHEQVGRPPNRVPDPATRAAAWIYLKAKQTGIKGVTKTKLKSVPGVKKNALDRAIDSYDQFLENGNKPVEVVSEIDDPSQL